MKKPLVLLATVALAVLLVSGAAAAQTGMLYVFDDSTSGRIVDASGHGHDLRLGYGDGPDRGDPRLETDGWNPGLRGDRWLRFDGIDDHAYSPSFHPARNAFTLECRFERTDNANLFSNEVLISTRGLYTGGWELRIESVIGTPNVAFSWYDADGQEHAVRGGAPFEFNRTYHVAVVYFHAASVTTVVLYVDGLPVAVKSEIGARVSYAGTTGLYLGNSADGLRFNGPKLAFRGTLDDVRLEEEAMDSGQIFERYRRPMNAIFDWGGVNRPGGQLFMGPHCPAEVNRPYVILLSTTPPDGRTLPGPDTRPLPIGLDGLTYLLIGGTPLATGISGTLIDAGWGFGTFQIPALPGLAGVRLYGAFAVLDPLAPNGVRRLSLRNENVLGAM